MKDIKQLGFFQEFCDTADNMYRLGWDERNGGNISLLLDEKEADEIMEDRKVIRTIPLGFDASELAGNFFLVTGTGKYFKNVKKDPEHCVGILRISKDGKLAELYWGYEDGGRFTSELPSHLMGHIARLRVDPHNRVVMHTHPTNLVAMTYVHELDSVKFTHTLWQMSTESIVVFPDGVEVLPWMLCGTEKIGKATAQKFLNSRTIIWAMHGVYGAGKNLDEAFGLIETVEKAAQIYMLSEPIGRVNTITDDQLKELAHFFKVDYRKDVM